MGEGSTHQGRVEWEGGVPEEVIHDLASLAWPGVFSGGKSIIATQHQPSGNEDEGDELILVFNDSTAIRIYGKFEVTYRHNVSVEDPEVIDSSVTEEEEPEQLTSGTEG